MLFSGICAVAGEIGDRAATGELRYRAKNNVPIPMRTIAATAAVHSQAGWIFGVDAARSNFPFKDRRSASISAIVW